MSADDPGRRLLVDAARPHWTALIGAAGLLCVWQICEAGVPVLIGVIVDHAVIAQSLPWLIVGLAGFIGWFVVLSLGYRFGARIANRVVNEQTHRLRVRVAGRALNPRGLDTRLLPGEQLSIATADADVASGVFRLAARGIASVVGVVAIAVYLLITDWAVALVILLGVPLMLLAIRLVTPLVSRRTATQQDAIARASGQAADLMQGLRILKGIGGEAAAAQRYREANLSARDGSAATLRGLAALEGLQQVLIGLLVAGVVLAAGLRLLAGELSIGELIAVVGLVTFLAEPLSAAIQVAAALARSIASARRLADFTALASLLPDGPEPAHSHAPVLELAGVSLAAAEPVDVAVQTGEFVALVLPDVIAADRLEQAIAGESRLESGRIVVAGVDRDELSLAAAQRFMVVAPHHADLFEGTLGSNVMVRSDPDRAVVPETVLAASATDELVGLFPDGLRHRVDATGANLSGGQRQRVALARALAADPDLLVLRDPTTAVDSVTEQRIADATRRLRTGRTTVVITHSPAFLAVADWVAFVSAGAVRIGRHSELMVDCPAYLEAVSHQ